MKRCFGLLGAGPSSDSKRVGLAVESGALTATEAGGASWTIPLTRVHLVGWAQDELRLELAGTEVSFIPEEPEAVLADLVPALLARQERGAALAGTAVGTVLPIASESPELTVDLTPGRQQPIRPATRPTAPQPERTRAGGAPPPDRSRAEPRSRAQVAPRVRGRRRWYWLFVVAAMALGAVLAMQLGGSEDGGDVVSSNVTRPTATPTTVPASVPDPSATARTALADAGLTTAAVDVESGVAVLTGTVASDFERREAGSVVSAVGGVDQIDNQLVVAPRADDTIESAARAALDTAGFDDISVSVQDGVAIVSGTVPPEVLGDGFFRYSDAVEDAVLRVAGVAGLTNRLQLAGNEATLRRQLRDLTDSSPVVFALGRSDLSAATVATLDAAAEIIQAQPGLRVLIAGHTDTTGSAGLNEALSGERAQAVRSYLIEQGIAANRLLIVAYGELFPTTPGAQPADRRVEFEVAG